jgi:hypothetical protein
MIHSFVRILSLRVFLTMLKYNRLGGGQLVRRRRLFSSDEQPAPPADLPIVLCRIELLEKKPVQSRKDAAEHRVLVGQRFDAGGWAEIVNRPGPPSAVGPTQRDYDTHYLSSY